MASAPRTAPSVCVKPRSKALRRCDRSSRSCVSRAAVELADAIHLALADAVAEQFERRGGTLRPLHRDHVTHERKMRARQRHQLVRSLPALRGTGQLRQLIELTVERALGGVVRRERFLLSREHVTLYAALSILQGREHDADLIERRAPMEKIEIGTASRLQLAGDHQQRCRGKPDQQQRDADRQPKNLPHFRRRRRPGGNRSGSAHNDASLRNTRLARSCASASRSTACSRCFASTAAVS